jgi:hypothetical protein
MAGDRTTISVFDGRTQERKGTIVEKGNGDVNLYDRQWNRTGSGSRRQDGSIQIYSNSGERRIQVVPGSTRNR